MTKTYNNYEDLLDFTRASEGYTLRPVSYGTELVTNGTFESDATGYSLTNCTLVTDSSDPYEGSNSGLFTSTGATGRAVQDFTTVVGRVYRLTAFSKYNSGDTGSIEILGVVENNSQTFITSSDTDWKLIQYNFVATATEHQLRLRERGVNNDASFFVDNVSIKEVTFDESDGTLTLFEHPEGVPRVEYDVLGNRLGLLVEESRSNLIPYSDFSSGWTKASGDFQTPNSGIAPDGTNTAVQYEVNSSGSLYDSITVTASTEYTFSWYVKRASSQVATQSVYAFYDESNSAFIERTVYSIPSSGGIDGWHRQSHTFTTPAGCTSVRVYPLGAEGSGGVVIKAIGRSLIWGAQLEAGAFSTSFIETTGSTTTRSQDVANIDLSSFGYNHKKGSLLIDVLSTYASNGSAFRSLFHIGSTVSVVDRINVYISEGGPAMSAEVRANNVQSAGLSLETLTENPVSKKVTFAFAEDDFAASDDGDTAVTDTSGTLVPLNKRNRLSLGSSTSAGNAGRFHIKSFKYYPRRLTNAQLEDLSS
jgi:hypothetical protein